MKEINKKNLQSHVYNLSSKKVTYKALETQIDLTSKSSLTALNINTDCKKKSLYNHEKKNILLIKKFIFF